MKNLINALIVSVFFISSAAYACGSGNDYSNCFQVDAPRENPIGQNHENLDRVLSGLVN